MNKKDLSDKTKTLQSSGETGRTIGPYHLLQKIGEGGMGEVWVAEQHKPIHRRVALKLIKAGMDTRQVIARFESERQALAMMDHPAIAKVFDAGETEDGRPYFVMEYVQGISITAHCDQNRLTTQERLELFRHVCEGVQHAHQKAIIHRDLKPSNILILIQDGVAMPKIIDFGVAKATAQSLTERTMYTELGVLIGTPEYMSPEQAEMSGQNVDTRTDVYSLGAILYELLIGALPFDPKDLRRAGFDEIRRKIREEDPPRPSTKLSTMGEASTAEAQKRRTEPAALLRQVRGDLDWITMKALEKDRTRRYGSPAELAADIDRYLHHQPIFARPPSTVYKAKKFVRRHRVGVGVAATLAVLLIAFSVTTAIQARRIARERDRANQEAEASRQVSDFLTELFKVSDPSEARGNSVTAREILDKGAEKISLELQGQPVIQGKLMNTMGIVYRSLGLFDPAQALLEKALELRTKALGPDHPDVAVTLSDLGYVLWRKGDFARAKVLQEQALAIRERRLNPDAKEVANSLHDLGTLNYTQGNYAEARRLLERSLAIREKILGLENADVANTLNSLGAIAYKEGDYGKAAEIWERTLAVREKVLGPDHPYLAHTLNNLAIVHIYAGDPKRAVPLLERVIRIQEKVLGPKHPDLASGLSNLGDAISRSGDPKGAKPYHARAVAIMEGASPDNPELARFLDRLAHVMLEEGDWRGAQKLYERSLALRQKALDPKSPEVGESLGGLADCAFRSGRLQEAEILYERALALVQKPDGSYYPGALDILKGFAALHRATNREARAAEIEAQVSKLEPR
ncbi:MAG: serine/threonine-protein kinase [Candidatus Aminicenantales bacterium]